MAEIAYERKDGYMALTKAQLREILSEAGLEAEQMNTAISKIISGHSASLEALREEVSTLREDVEKYKKDAEKLPGVQAELKTLKEDAEKNKDKDYDALKQEFDNYKAEITSKEAQAVKEKVYREALKDANLSETGIDKAVKYANWDSIEVDDKGALKEAKKHIKEAQEEWAAYVVNKRTEGAGVNNPPGGQGGSGKPEVSAAAQLAKAYYADRYGATKED